MSGLEPLVVLGLACNILQIVGTGQKTIAFVSNVYKTGTFDNRIKEHAKTLATLSPTIGGIHPPISVSHDEQQLIESANKCQTICKDILREIEKLEKGVAKKSKASTAALTMKVIGKKLTGNWKLDDLEKQLQEAKDLVQLSLVDRTYSRVRTMHIDLSILPHDLRSFIGKWEDGERESSKLVSVEATGIKEHVTEAVNRAQAAQEARVLERKQTERRQKLLRSLKYNGMNERRNDHHVHHPSTLKTIWNDDLDTELWGTFRNWLRSQDQVFWISGKPGSGKTTLMKFLVSRPQTREWLRIWNSDVIVVSHFIWLLGPEPMQRNLKGVFCSVIHQVLTAKPTIADHILGASDAVSLKENPTDWSLEELQNAWSAMMKEDSIPVCLFLDGLDEIDPEDGTGALLDILKDNFQPFPHVKLCMASRPEPLLRTRLDQAKYPSLALHDVNRQDITRFVESALILQGERREFLKGLLIEKARGVFLWTHLVLRNVNRALELSQEFDEVWRYIDSLPEGLEDLYKSMWARMSKDERQVNSMKVALYFRLLIQAQKDWEPFRPDGIQASLSVLQLALAVAPLRLEILKSRNPSELSNQAYIKCEKTTFDIVNSCAGFLDVTTLSSNSEDNWSYHFFAGRKVVFGEQRTKVDFVHRSAVDFLVDTPEGRAILDENRTTFSAQQLDTAMWSTFTGHFWITEYLTYSTVTRLANLIIDAGVDITERCYVTDSFGLDYDQEMLAGSLEYLLQSLFRLIGWFSKDGRQKPPPFVPCLYGEALDLIGAMIKAGTNVSGSVILALQVREDNFPFIKFYPNSFSTTWVEVPMKGIIRATANCLLLDCRMRSPDTTRDVREACTSLATLLEETDRFLEPDLVDLIENHHSDHTERDLVLEEGKQLARLARDILHLDTAGESASLEEEAYEIFGQRRYLSYEDYSKRIAWVRTYVDAGAFWKAVDGWETHDC
ncbi:hypothetical protein PG991_011877 [Apiospora marii]|uniref:Nephrocystin 3-like N-terminal domain-containing protein n=1 Tax=Apiospora marii TaxID=335849 RepID=A0ABR1RFF7_9PEZI